MAEEDSVQTLVHFLLGIVNEVSSVGDYIKSHRRQCSNLSRRIKLLGPLFEELKESKVDFPEEVRQCLLEIKETLKSAKEILSQCRDGSKLHLILDRESIADRFQSITTVLAHAMDGLPYDILELSDEVREQIELLHSQLKRAKGRGDTSDSQVYADLMTVLSQEDGHIEVLEKLGARLELRTVSQLIQENRALQNMIMEKDGNIDEVVEKISSVLRKLKDIAVNDIPETDTLENGSLESSANGSVIPDDFRCPISLELMKDPVIVATGQTYERSYIQRWIDAGHKTCPKTQQVLPHLVLTPNYVLRSLISQWCEVHGIELPKKTGTNKCGTSEISPGDRLTVDTLLQNLMNDQVEVQREAAAELRQLAKRSVENRICIAEAGGIPLLVELLRTDDLRTQEHAVTALLNLSIHEQNKGQIVLSGAINPIVEVLKHGSMEARENAAATLFSLSVVDENKVTIGATGAIPALVDLLRDGSSRGKKDAATALFNLSIYQGNKARAVRAGVVPPLMQLLADPNTGMVDEALAILAILVTHQEGRVAIGQASPIPVLVELITAGSPRNKENAAAVMLALSTYDTFHIAAAHKLGAFLPLTELARSGTSRARRKATSILEQMLQMQPSP